MGIADSLGRGVRLTGDSIGQSIDFAKTGFWGVMKYLLAGAGALLLAAIVGSVFAFGLTLAFGDGAGGIWNWGLIGVIGVVLGFAGVTYCMASYLGAIEYVYTGKRVPYFSSENAWAALKFILFAFVFLAIFYAALFAGILAFGSYFATAFDIAFVPVGLALGVMFYYLYAEIAVNKRGPFDALCNSWKIAKGNFWETAMIFLAVYVVSGIIWGIMYLVGIAVALSFLFGLTLGGMDATGWAILGLLALAAILLALAVYLLMLAATTIVNTKFYKNVIKARKK